MSFYFFEPGGAGVEKISGRLPAILPFLTDSGGSGVVFDFFGHFGVEKEKLKMIKIFFRTLR